jgi:hypothetical protein
MDQIERLKQSVDDSTVTKSTAFGTQKLTITDNRVQGTSQACRSCLIHVPSSNSGRVYLANETADTNDWLVPVGQAIPVPVENINELYFYGTSNGDVIYVLWRN